MTGRPCQCFDLSRAPGLLTAKSKMDDDIVEAEEPGTDLDRPGEAEAL